MSRCVGKWPIRSPGSGFAGCPFGTRVPHPTTLMKITTRCGDDAVAGLNEALLAKAAAAKLLRTDKVRADTTVVEAVVAYPTDSGLLAKAIGTMARSVERIKAAGGARRTRVRDRRRAAGRRARSIAAKLRLRGQQHRDQAQAAVHRITGELAGIAEQTMREATAVIRNARRALRAATGQRKGAAAAGRSSDLDTVIGRTERVVAQARSRLGGVMPECGQPAGQPARCRRPPDPQRTAWASLSSVGYKAQIVRQRRRGHPRPQRRDGEPRRRPAAGPGDRPDHRPHRTPAPRGHRRPRLRRGIGGPRPTGARRAQCGDPAQGQTQCRAPRASNTGEPSATRSNGAPDPKDESTEHRKRSYGWNRTESSAGIHGARTWCGTRRLRQHNLVKIGGRSQHETDATGPQGRPPYPPAPATAAHTISPTRSSSGRSS